MPENAATRLMTLLPLSAQNRAPDSASNERPSGTLKYAVRPTPSARPGAVPPSPPPPATVVIKAAVPEPPHAAGEEDANRDAVALVDEVVTAVADAVAVALADFVGVGDEDTDGVRDGETDRDAAFDGDSVKERVGDGNGDGVVDFEVVALVD